jgi:hypothetical protein
MAVSGLRLAFGSRLFWFGLAFAGFGLLWLGIGAQWGLRELHFGRDAHQVEATIVSKDIKRASQQQNSSTEYRLRYRFTPQDGAAVEGTAQVPVEQWESAQPGGKLAIGYLPEDPASNRLAGKSDWFSAIFASAFGSVFAAVGGIVLWLRIRRIRLIVRLMRDGIATEGTVLHVRETGTSINRVRQWRLDYQFTDSAGQQRGGVSELMSPEKARRWKKGERGSVRYDRGAPEQNIWVDDRPAK